MYHIGKILEVWAGKAAKGDESVQATLEMWDENIITLKADTRVSKSLKPGDVVLVDYTPVISGSSIVPKQLIVKALEAKAGERAWQTYKEFHKKQRTAKAAIASNMQSNQ
jgi:hypothetical protein